ncbi:hypothetical protein ACFUAG_28340 [Streptomyces sp. NPDC057193]|uniref:hypothetical protein n=1 Tax=Streptomyces sp. NPDC057193 TaxID=3346043 RepID=UPI003636E89F
MRWELLAANRAMGVFLGGAGGELPPRPFNVLRTTLHPDGLRTDPEPRAVAGARAAPRPPPARPHRGRRPGRAAGGAGEPPGARGRGPDRRDRRRGPAAAGETGPDSSRRTWSSR